MSLIERTYDVAKKHWHVWDGIVSDIRGLSDHEDDEMFQNDVDGHAVCVYRFLRDAKRRHMGPEEFQRVHGCYLCAFCYDLTADLEGIDMCQICPLGSFHLRCRQLGSPYNMLYTVTTKADMIKYAKKIRDATSNIVFFRNWTVGRFKRRVRDCIKDVPQAIRDKFSWDEVVTLICFAKRIPLSLEPADIYSIIKEVKND